MNLHVINTGFFKLDGGAMFGVVPKSLWQRTNPSDSNNLCTWAMRSLLIENGSQLILIDSGIGDKQDEKFLKHYFLHGDDSLETSLHHLGFQQNDISDLFHTHLHFDHCGGGIKRKNDSFELVFKNANYWTHSNHWEWATKPNAREKASFLRENIIPMEESGHLNFVNNSKHNLPFSIITVDGHTEKQMLPKIKFKDHTIVFVADLLPSVGHFPLPYVMGYDTRPLITLSEKKQFLDEAAENNYILFFQHDPINECCTVKHTDKGVRVDKIFKLSDI